MKIDTHALDFISLLIDHPGIVDMLQSGNARISMPDYLSYLDILIDRGHYEACILLLAWALFFPPVNQAFSDLFKRQLTAQWQQADSKIIMKHMVRLVSRQCRSSKKYQETFA